MPDDQAATVPCPTCGQLMTAVASVPRFASHPELVTYQCTVCLEVVTSPEGEDE